MSQEPVDAAVRAPERTAVTPHRPDRFHRIGRAVEARLRALRERVRVWEARAPRLIAISRALFYPCALVLVGFMGYRAAQEVRLSQVAPGPLAAAVGAALVWWVCLALGWAFLSGDTDRGHAMTIWCKTQVARYLPGGIWQLVARATTVQGRVRDKLTAVSAENIIVLLVSLAVGGALAAAHQLVWLPLALLVTVPLLASRWLERHTLISRRQVRRTAGAYAIGYLAYATLGVLVQVAISGMGSPTELLYVAGASCVAWAVGLVVVIAPGGVGVREVVYVWMLSGIYSRPELEGGAVTSRVVTILAELSVLAVLWLVARSRAPAPADDIRQGT